MKRPRLSALRSWSAAQLSLLILAGILSVWVMGAIAYGFVSNLNAGDESGERREAAPTTRNLESEPGDVPDPESAIETPPPAGATPVSPANFSIDCTNPAGVRRESVGSFQCEVRSRAAFSQDVTLTCANLPAGMSCEPRPSVVRPEPDGTADFRLLITNHNVEPGRYQFKVVGSAAGTSVAFNFPFDTSSPARPSPAASPAAPAPPAPRRVEIQCQTGSTRLIPGQSITYDCIYSSQTFEGAVATRCSGTPGIACGISPQQVMVRPGEPAPARLSLNVAPNISSAGSNQVMGVYGDPQGAPPAVHRFTVDVPLPDYAVTCAPKTIAAAPGQPASVRCTVTNSSAYAAPFHLKLATDSTGPRAALDRATVQVGARGSAGVTVTFESDATTAPGSYRYALGVHADPSESFPAGTGETNRNAVLTVTVPEPEPSPSPTTASPSPTA